jgi:hypothetical protein
VGFTQETKSERDRLVVQFPCGSKPGYDPKPAPPHMYVVIFNLFSQLKKIK